MQITPTSCPLAAMYRCEYAGLRASNFCCSAVGMVHFSSSKTKWWLPMTTRSPPTAIAKQVGVDRFFAEVLPEDKANFVQQAKAEGHTVVMIGDGINDSPALSAADIGIAINSGAAIAREIADVTIKADSLEELVALKAIANSLQKRVHANYRFVLTFNSALIALGALGILQPASSAMLHNLSTIGISLKSMTNLLPENKAPQLKA